MMLRRWTRHALMLTLLLLAVAAPALAAQRIDPGDGPGGGSPADLGATQDALVQNLQTCGLGGLVPLPVLQGVTREVVVPGIAHYRWTLRTGPGAFDRIQLHRVVRERRAGVPISTVRAFFYQHGDAKNFVGMMLPGTLSASTPDDFGLAVFLAQNNVDVWGVDQAWCLVPADQTDFTPMKDWGLDRAVRDLRIGIVAARTVRALTGCSAERMIVAGYSSGVWSTGALADLETQLPPALRQVGAWVPMDAPYVTDDPEMRAVIAADLALQRSMFDAGQYLEPIPFQTIGVLARTQPDDPSPLAPGFTNLQLMLYYSATPGGAGWPAPSHFWAGVLGSDGMATTTRLTPMPAVLDFLESAIPWQPVKWFIDYDVLALGLEPSPYDDHLGAIRVPVLAVEAAGGIDHMDHFLSLLGSSDIDKIVVSDGSPADIDVGHIDLFTWPEAPQQVWQPILDWIVGHPMSPGPMAARAADEAAAVTPAQGASALRAGPNPARGSIDVSFSLAGRAPARLEVLDVTGRAVLARDLGSLGTGLHRMEIDGLGALSPGVYLIRVTEGATRSTQRIAVIR